MVTEGTADMTALLKERPNSKFEGGMGSKSGSYNNLLTNTVSRGGEEEIDYEGITNPSVNKLAGNAIIGGFEDPAYATDKTVGSA